MASNYKKVISLGLDYSDFTGGIKECNEEMKKLDSQYGAVSASMEKSASSSQKLAEKEEYLTKKIELQQKKVEAAKEKYDQLIDSQANTSQINKAETAFNKEAETLAKLQNEFTETAVSSSNLKETMSALVGIVTAVAAGFTECAKAAAEYADNVQTMSEQTGMTTDTLQVLSYASELIDTDVETVANSFKKLESNMANSPEKFRELGVDIEDSSGHMRDAEDVFWDVIDALGDIDNATEQDQAAMDIFGKSASELTGVINMGSEGFKDYAKQAKEMGYVLNDQDFGNLTEMDDSLQKLSDAFTAVKNNIGADFAPLITNIANALNSLDGETVATVAEFAAFAGILGALIAVVMSVSSVIGTMSAVSQAAGAVMAALGVETATAGAAMSASLAPIFAIIAAITALIAVIYEAVTAYQQFKKLQDSLSDATGQDVSVGQTLKYAFTGSMSSSSGGGHSFASGTSYAPGGLSLVGENGPELVDLPTGSKVYTNEESSKMMGDTTYNINMNCDLSKMKTVNDVVNAVQGLANSKRSYA